MKGKEIKTEYPGKPEDRQILSHEFSAIFKISLNEVLDTFMSFIMRRHIVDIVKFENLLINRYGDYTNDGISLSEFVEKKFGIYARELLEKML